MHALFTLIQKWNVAVQQLCHTLTSRYLKLKVPCTKTESHVIMHYSFAFWFQMIPRNQSSTWQILLPSKRTMNKKCRRNKLCTIKLFKGSINIRKYEITLCIIWRFDHRIFIFDKSNFVLRYKLNIVLSSIDDYYQVESFYKQESKMKGVLREPCHTYNRSKVQNQPWHWH